MANSDYISREAVLRDWPLCDEPGDAYQFIRNFPAADVVEVVRCKDCMYAPSGIDGGEDQGFALEWPHDEWPEDNPCPCKCEDGWYSHKPKPDFFCANGKREEI